MRNQLIAVLLFLAPFHPLKADEEAATPQKGGSEVFIRDIYAAVPDSIFPLLTKNNRLDQIDFRENDMQAVIKNHFDDHSELLVLGDRYLKLQLSEHCVVEMRLLSDSTFCMVQTYNAPASDSRIRLFDTAWHELSLTVEPPSVDDFLNEDIDTDIRLSLQALPLIKASLSEVDDNIVFELQTSELTREQRKRAEGKVHGIIRNLKTLIYEGIQN